MSDDPATKPLPWDLPDPFHIEIDVRDEDIDDYDHVNNAVYLRWLDQVTWEHAEAVGAGNAVHIDMRRGMANYRTELQYLLPAVKDDRVTVGNWIVFWDGRLRGQRRFQVIRPSDGATLLRAQTQYVCIDLDTGKPARVPKLYNESYVLLPSVRAALAESDSPFSVSW